MPQSMACATDYEAAPWTRKMDLRRHLSLLTRQGIRKLTTKELGQESHPI